MKLIFRTFIILSLAALSAACSSNRNVTSSQTPAGPGKSVPAIKSEVVTALGQTYTDWDTFYAPFTLRVSKPSAMNISGRATMIHGKSILLSMRMLGIEVATAYIDSDSAWVADKYHKNLCVVPLKSLSASTGLTISDVQDILLGRAFYPGRGTVNTAGSAQMLAESDRDGNYVMLSPRRISGNIDWHYTADISVPRLMSLEVSTDVAGPFVVSYPDCTRSAEAGTWTTEARFEGKAAGVNMAGSLIWDTGKAKWNDSRTAERPSYRGYRRMGVAEFLKSLKSF